MTERLYFETKHLSEFVALLRRGLADEKNAEMARYLRMQCVAFEKSSHR